ncbi:MAG: DUF4114 domain-containing protein [Richelia sp. SM1_7_0]|nr:DUF4114 domain-containing protein [Richelia sp. SM1_7_0]
MKTQPGNKIQFLQFADGSLYTINIEEKYQNLEDILSNGISENLDLSNIPKVKHATLKLYEKDPTIKDFGLDVLPSQVSLSLSGNNLIINGEIIANWLTNTDKRLEILRFADGSRFKIVVENNSTVKLENELVANFNTVLAKAIEFNLSTPQSSDNYKGNNVTEIIYGSGGVVQGNDNSDDVLISSSQAETLQGGKGDDVYRYSLGSGKDTIEDIGGVDVIEFDSNIQLSNLQLQQSGNNLIINIINPSNPSAPITDQLTINNFTTNKIEFIRLGNNEEYLFDNSSGQWQLKAANSVQTSNNSNTTIQGTIGADVLRGLEENDTLSGGAGNDTYLYSFGDGLNTTIYDTGDYEGKVRDGGIDTLVLDTNIIHSLKLQNKDLIVTVSYILPSFNSSSGTNEAQPITITIKNWVDENSRIEFIRLGNGKDFYPTLAADGSVSLQPVLTQGESTLDVQLDIPDSYALSSYKLAVVDLFANGLQLISAQNSFAMSDLDNDGSLEQTGWVSPADGILVIDQNNDGRITELNEFISLASQANVTYIASLNSNGDRVLNSQDTNFEKIRIWIDANGNHRVELGELAALHRYGIEEISLASQQKNFEIAGNLITASTYFTQLGYEFRKRSQIFDVAFAYNPDGVKLETLPGGINKFNFENKPDIIIADDTAGNLNLTIDPTVTYSVTGGKGNDILTILASSTTGGILNGGAGDDTLTGGSGSDIINGGEGKDIIKAGAGDDTITVDKDDIITSLDGGEGFDIVTIDADSRLHLILKDSNNIEAIIGTKISNQITYSGVKPILISGDFGNDNLTGGEGSDQIEGGEGKDKLYGNKGNDLLLGGNGDDSLYGEQGDDKLYGQEGDDFLDGGDGNNILDGGLGNDSLKGGLSENTYVFGRNYGIDTITQNRNAEKDIISFKAGISPSDIAFWRRANNDAEKNNLYLAIKNTHDRLIITDQLANNTYGINQFTFANGTIWTRENIEAWLLQSTSGDDYLLGYNGDDTLDGGAGNDLLNGGAGNNTYIFGRGYGIDTIAENYNTGTDTLSFKAGINTSDIILWRKPNSISEKDNLYLGIKNTHDQIIIEDQFRNGPYGVDQFIFANGTIWTRDNIQTLLLQSTPDDDYLLGYQGNDTLDGSAGNDLLNGGAGNNTYIFGRGYGIDTIVENYNIGTDTVSFKADISKSDIVFWRKTNISSEKDNLYLAIKNTNDRLIIEDQFRSGPYGIDQFIFADGTTVTRSEINSMSLPNNFPEDNLLTGDANANTLENAIGNDTLAGSTGDDTYIFNLGYGQDTIQEDYSGLNSYYDTVKFGAGLTTNTMEIIRQGDDLVFKVKGSSDRLTIKDQFDYAYEVLSIEEFQFDNGAIIWTKEDIKQYLLKSTNGDNYIVGYSEGINNETLDGGLGNDTLVGGAGDDTYIFNLGYGQDTIEEYYLGLNSYYDTVKFGAGLTTNTMEIIRQGDDLVFKVKGSSDRLTIKDQFDYPYEVLSVEEFQFDNGAIIWTKEDIKQYLLKSTNGDDYIVGYSEGINNETLDGDLGDDTLAGGSGNDTYIFKESYGQDVIQEDYYFWHTNEDTVKFGRGLTPQTMEIVRQGNDLIFKVNGTTDTLTIKGQFATGEYNSVEEFQFDNGAVIWNKEDIKNYVTGVFLTFNQAHYSISENGTSANAITINRIGNSNNTLTVTLTPSNGTAIAPAEFDNTPIIVNFASGETSKVVYIPIVDDAIVEGSKTLTLTLSNPTGGAALGFQKTATLTILDNDSENEPPIVEDAIFLLAENSADGTSIGTVTASDPNTSDTLTYAITTGNSDPDNDSNVAFAINSTTGEITVADSGDLDFESTPSFNLTVTVTDAEGLSGDAAIRVNLTDIDENTPPIITSNATFQVSENTTTLGRITAEDADGNDLSFSISGGADQGLFTIDSDSGELSFKNAPDFENAGSANGDNNFQVQISVSDDIDTVTQDLTISVTDVDENTPPTITSNANFSVVENIKTVGTITAEDADGNDLTFSISGGADQALFIIDSNSGELSFNNVPDFENASNANSDNNYQVSVEVSDRTETVTQDLTISVTNENEPPTIDDAIVTVDENSEEETQVAIITASDPENETLNFAIISGNFDPDNDNNLAFAIDPSTGIITVNDKDDLDFETNPSFNLEVTATDAGNLSDTAEVTVNLGDVPPGLFDTNQSQNGIFTLSGDSNNLKFILNNVGTDNVNEVGVFVVDDENGNVDGLAPSSEGYLKAALQRAQVVFSAISDFPSGFGLGDIERVIEVNGDARLGFYIISNGTTDTALADLESTGTTSVPVFFSDSSNLQVSDLSEEGFELNWSDEIGSSDFTDMELSVQLTQDTPAPFTQLQRETQKELIDLRDVTGKISISVEVYREAAFDNLIGFYQITDTNGGIDTNNDGVADFNPGQIGYKEAALSNRVTSLDLLQTDNQQATTFDGTFDGGSILAPFIVIDGSVDKAINNNAEVYFSFLGANSDGVDHIRLLGDNTFGFEDLPGGGDLDYNDMIIKVDFPAI